MNVTQNGFKNRQLHIEDYLQKVSAEQGEYAEVFAHSRITENNDEGKSGKSVEGRRQKVREGKWNGIFAPYGYQLINGELHIAEDEEEVIRIIYDKFANTTMGIAAIAIFLNNSGYKKKLRQNNTIEGFRDSEAHRTKH